MKHKFNYEGVEFDFDEFSKLSKIEQAHKLLPIAVQKNYGYSLSFIEIDYEDKSLFSAALEFLEFCVPEIIPSSKKTMQFVNYELESLLNRSIYLAYTGFYKESNILLRSALELSLVISMFYLKLDYKDEDIQKMFEDRIKELKESNKWFFSRTSTPSKGNFEGKSGKGSLGDFFYNQSSFNNLISKTQWAVDFKNLWNELSNYIHSNGIYYMSVNLSENYKFIPIYKKEAIKLFCDNYIKTLQMIGIIAVTTRPELINKNAIEEFDRIGEPYIGSGMWGLASEIFFGLIPEKYEEFFITLSKFEKEGKNGN